MGRDVSPSFKKNGLDYQNIVIFAGYNIDSLSLMKSLIPSYVGENGISRGVWGQ